MSLPRRPQGPSRGEIVRGIAGELEAAGVESALIEAELLVAGALGVPRAHVRTESGERVAADEALAIARAVSRRLGGEPLQHIEGRAAFRRIELVADRRALIPRPETEELVDRISRWIGDRAPLARALDIGTGSGAIALSLLEEGLAREVVALDVSEAALGQARENAEALNARGLDLRRCEADVWSAVEPGEQFDLVVSNPPYVTAAEWAGLEPQVRDHEPSVALVGGEDGLDVVRSILSGAAGHLAAGGRLYLEIGASQGPAVLALLEADPDLDEAAVEADLAGRDRFARARKRAGDRA